MWSDLSLRTYLSASSELLMMSNTAASPDRPTQPKERVRDRPYWKVRSDLNKVLPDKRRLTSHEEILTGKLCKVAKELEKKKKVLEKALERDITIHEWAMESNLTVAELKQTIKLSQLAREKLILHNLRLVDYVVCDLMDRKTPSSTNNLVERTSKLYTEMFQQGVMGLKKATEYYDGRYKFSYFAIHFIQQECYRYRTTNAVGSYVPHEVMLLGIRINNMKKRMTEELQRSPTTEELSQQLSFSSRRIQKVLSYIAKNSNIRSLSATIYRQDSSGDSLSFQDALVRSTPVELTLSQKVLRDYIEQATVLTTLEKEAILLSYGLSGGRSMGPLELGKRFNMRGDRITAMIECAVEKLQANAPFSGDRYWINSLTPSVGLVPSMTESTLFA